MNSGIPPEMAEATRLTKTGKLAEATALIQRMLGGWGGSQTDAGSRAGTTIDAEYEAVDTPPKPAPPVGRIDARLRAGLGETLRRLAGAAKARAPGFGLDLGTGLRRAPEPLPDGATFATASYANAAGARDYKLYVPSKRGGQRLPLIVMLHGCTQSPDDFAAGTGMNALAEEHGCFVAYPAQPASANTQKCWNWFKPEDQQHDLGEPSLIAGITRQIMRDHPVDPSRVFVAGLSAGGAAATIMGAAYPDLYAAVGVHSGLPAGAASDLPSAFAAMRQGPDGPVRRVPLIPTIVFHGDQDATVNPRNGDAVVAAVTASASGSKSEVTRGQVAGGRSYRRVVYTDASNQPFCEQWTIQGAGHAWSGGRASGSYTDPQGPDASREMLRFFSEHRLGG